MNILYGKLCTCKAYSFKDYLPKVYNENKSLIEATTVQFLVPQDRWIKRQKTPLYRVSLTFK